MIDEMTLQAMENSAPMLVAEVRKLQGIIRDQNLYLNDAIKAAQEYGRYQGQELDQFIRELGQKARTDALSLEDARAQLAEFGRAAAILVSAGIKG